jgi:hypothetical protein
MAKTVSQPNKILELIDKNGKTHALSTNPTPDLLLDGVVVGGGGVGVASLNSLTGALDVTSPLSSLGVSTSGTDVTVDIDVTNVNTWTAVIQSDMVNATDIYILFKRRTINSWCIENANNTNQSIRWRSQDDTGYVEFIKNSTASLLKINAATSEITTLHNTLDDGSGLIQPVSFKMTASAGANKVLMSDGVGVGTWQSLAAFGVVTLNSLAGALTVTTPNSTLSVGTSGSDVTIDINTAHSNSWSLSQTFQAITITNGTQVLVNPTSGTAHVYNVSATDEVLALTAGSTADLIVNLPAAASTSGRKLIFIKADTGSNNVVVTVAGGDTIEGVTTKTLVNQYDKVGLVSDGTSTWYNLGTGGGI